MTNTRPTVFREDQPEDPETTPGMKCGGGGGPAYAGHDCYANAGKLRAGNAHDGMSRDVAPVPGLPVVYQIPPPPSVNAMYRNVPGRGRVKTKRYLTWQRAAMNELIAQRARHFDQPCNVNLSLPDNQRGDIDNRLKPVLDLLVSAGVLTDDNKTHVRGVSAFWVAKWLPCQVSLVAA
jgi:Holliday junction resolvase RusA-like endonuclease